MRFDLRHGDSREVLPLLDAASVDALVTDPPAGIGFMGRAWDSYSVSLPPADFLNWFAGFVDGEGCFSVHRKPQDTYDCQFSISLRADDEPILREIQRTLGIGTLARTASGDDVNAKARFCVSSKAHCVRLVEILRAAPLRAKKALDFETWVEALDAWMRHKPGEWADMADARDRLMSARAFTEYGKAAGPPERRAFIAALKPIFRECLRVLKPGAHGLVWAIPRTSHWTATALEDAGFAIRDIVVYLHGQGFPKNLNVSKSINRCACGPEPVRQSVRGVRADLHSEGGAGLQQVEAVQRSLLREMAIPNAAGAHAQDRVERQTRMDEREPSLLSREDDGREQSGVEGRGAPQADARELSGSEVRSVPAGVSGDGAARRVRDGASACDGASDRADPPADGSSPPRGSQPGEQRAGESVALARQPDAQAGGAWPRCARCGLPVVPDGLGTALKPSMEHWILVRKPLDGTVAANVAAHGTGALNIDACRIGTEPAFENRPGQRSSGGILNAVPGLRVTSGGDGRWPANVTLDEEAAALLDAQSGELHSQDPATRLSRSKAVGVTAMGTGRSVEYADSGGASRFFYVAKPDRGERDIGCEDLPAVSGGAATDRKDGSAGLTPRAGAGRNGGVRNIHPTVKSVDLMRWLCRLVTPKGGLVLDPFMGSGSTGIACAREGMRFIGIERERAYFEIARRRIVGDAPLLNRIGQLRLEGPDKDDAA